MPADVRAVFNSANLPRGHSNVLCFVLNSQGNVVHAFDALSRFFDRGPGKGAMTVDLKRQIAIAKTKLKLPTTVAKKQALAVPAVDGKTPFSGVRVYLWFGRNRIDHFRVPTVEAIKTTEKERAALRWNDQSRSVDAAAIKRWLEQIYPPAVMDGMGGFRNISGKLQWQRAGTNGKFRYATLAGKVSFEMDNRKRYGYSGLAEIVLKYSMDSTEPNALRGVMDTYVPRMGERIRMLVTLESLPAAD